MDRQPRDRHRAQRGASRRRSQPRAVYRPAPLGARLARLRRRPEAQRREDPRGDPDGLGRRGRFRAGVGMTAPVTGLYAGLLVLLLLVLGVRVTLLRSKLRVGTGHGNDPLLARAIRVHGNAVEW